MSSAVGVVFDCSGYDGSLPLHPAIASNKMRASEEFFAKYGSMAKAVCQEVPEHIHPHMMRHTRAMHLYQSGMPMVLLSQYLGHAQVETTMIYAYADTEMKRAAIQKADAVRGTKPVPDEIWADNEEMILKLSGLL